MKKRMVEVQFAFYKECFALGNFLLSSMLKSYELKWEF
jgi:hypothetical protein